MFWDPDRMYQWVNQKVANSSNEKQYRVLELGKTKGVVFDKSHLPAPEGPIWRQHLDPNLKTTSK